MACLTLDLDHFMPGPPGKPPKGPSHFWVPPPNPIHNPSCTNLPLPYSRTFTCFLFLTPSVISPTFLYRHCWLWPAPQANPGKGLKFIPVISLTSLENFPMGDNTGYLQGRNDWHGPWPINTEAALNLITNTTHCHRCSSMSKLPSVSPSFTPQWNIYQEKHISHTDNPPPTRSKFSQRLIIMKIIIVHATTWRGGW